MKLHVIARVAKWTRREWLLLAACAGLGVGAAMPWFTLPPKALEAFGESLWLPQLLRVVPIVGIASLACLAISSFGSHQRRRFRMSLWGSLFVCLLFPFFVATLSPAVAYMASAYDQQRECVAYHIETHYPDIHVQWKQAIDIDPFNKIRVYAPDGLTRGYVDPLLTLPNGRVFVIDNSGFFQASSWDRILMEGLNYLPGFLACAGWGWPITVGGLVVGLFAVYVNVPARFFPDLKMLLPWCMAGVAAVLFVIFAPCFLTRQISIWQARGENKKASAAAHLLYATYPPIRGDTAFMLQLAHSDLSTGRTTPGLIEFAKGIECWRAVQLDRSRSFLEQSLAEDPQSFLVRSYLSATLLRIGAHQFEHEQPVAAAETFKQAGRVFPNHVQAMYCRMIAQATHADFRGSAETAQQLREVQRYFRQPSIASMGQAYLHEAWAEYHAGELPEAWHAYRNSIDPGMWE